MARHIEMHLIENSKDLQLAETSGLDVYEDDKCENCYRLVGDSGDSKVFVPFLIILDDEAEWIVCKECAEPVL